MTTATVAFRCCAPMQSWGRTSRYFEQRDTAPYPTKTGITGLLCAAADIARTDTDRITDMAPDTLTVRIDHHGTETTDFQTVQGVMTRSGTKTRKLTRKKTFLADACFTVFCTYHNPHHAEAAYTALRDPARPLHFGRAAYPATSGINPAIIRSPDGTEPTNWAPCPIHPLADGDQATLITDAHDAAPDEPGIELWHDGPVDFDWPEPARAARLIRSTTITVHPTPAAEATYTIDTATGAIEKEQ